MGKTQLTSWLISQFLAQGQTGLVVMDLAPDLIKGIGGKMELPPDAGLRVYAPGMIAPRLTGGSPAEVEALSEQNAQVIEAVLAKYLRKPCACLFINDVSMYLQAREPQGLLALMAATPTVVMNGYLGTRLGGGQVRPKGKIAHAGPGRALRPGA